MRGGFACDVMIDSRLVVTDLVDYQGNSRSEDSSIKGIR